MYRNRNDPRLRRTLDHVSQNFESANESVQANLYSLSHNYLTPCLDSAANGLHACLAPCMGSRQDRLRRNRTRARGRPELSFDFYDDWENDEADGLLGWGNDELDRLLAGAPAQPGRQRAMSYGARRGDPRYPPGRRKSAVQPHDGGPDPTIIPNTSYFGFLGRLPWKIGGKGLRYKPSAADLQEHPGQTRRPGLEEQPLIEDSEEEAAFARDASLQRRQRSDTHDSAHTSDSLSSRGDIFPSEDELDDAVPLDDEFAMALERRNTGLGADDTSSGKSPHGKSRSRMSTRTASSRSTRESIRRSLVGSPQPPSDKQSEAGVQEIPTMVDLRHEEDRLRKEEEADIERKRDAARALASRRGLRSERAMSPCSETKPEDAAGAPNSATQETRTAPFYISSEPTSPTGTVPFPSFETHPTPPTPNLDSEAHDKPPTSDSRRSKEMEESGFVPACLPHFQPRSPPG